MGKSTIPQARGHGSLTYQVRSQAYKHRIGYPLYSGEVEILSLVKSAAHSAPLMKLRTKSFVKSSGKHDIFFLPAFDGAIVGSSIHFNSSTISPGNVLSVKDIPSGTSVYCLELRPGDSGKAVRVAGSSAIVQKTLENGRVEIQMPNRNTLSLDPACRAVIGTIAGAGRNLKPMMKAGNAFYKMKSRNKLWPRTSAVKMNAVDHPFGGGRAKRIKSKIAQRNAPPGQKAGHVRPRRTGRKKR